jgi:hypothetical protein
METRTRTTAVRTVVAWLVAETALFALIYPMVRMATKAAMMGTTMRTTNARIVANDRYVVMGSFSRSSARSVMTVMRSIPMPAPTTVDQQVAEMGRLGRAMKNVTMGIETTSTPVSTAVPLHDVAMALGVWTCLLRMKAMKNATTGTATQMTPA